MFDFGVFNSILSLLINRQQFARPVEASISPIVDIAMKVNKIQKDDLQPLKELSTRIASTLKKISKLETSRHRAAVAVRLENLDLKEERRLLMQLRNYSPVSTGTQTFVEKKPCRVRFVIPSVTWEEETINENWMYPKMIITFFCNRNDFKREPCKLCPLKGCTISLGDNPDTFLIKHPDQRNTYKFRAESDNTALQWYRRLYHAAQSVHQPDTKLPDNLISFD